jgi:hypothetical protein
MAIIAPADLPSVLKMRSEPMKKYVLSKMGFPVTEVEIMEDQWETIFRVAGDFIAGYPPSVHISVAGRCLLGPGGFLGPGYDAH